MSCNKTLEKESRLSSGYNRSLIEASPNHLATIDSEGTRSTYVLILVFVALALGIVTAGYLYYRNHEKHYRAEVERQLSAIAQLKADQIVEWRTDQLADAALLMESPFFIEKIMRWRAAPKAKNAEQVRLKNEELQRLNKTLGEKITRRTQSLQLSQETLVKLPVPVIGISLEGLIVLANEAVKNTFSTPCQIHIGARVQECFPPEVVDMVRLCLENGRPEKLPGFQYQGRRFRLRIEPLRGVESVRGCILTLEEIENE